MRWNAPLSVSHSDLLLDRLKLADCERVADLGCGWGELLLCAVERAAGARGIGVDTDASALDRGRTAARSRGLEDRIEFVEADVATWSGTADRVLCIGSSHAFGGTPEALTALAAHVPAGGRLLFGDGCWQTTPSQAALDVFGDAIMPLPELLEAARDAGWRTIHMSTADQLEWDDFESTFRASSQEWLLANDSDPRAEEVREWVDSREREYVRTYRGVLGFSYLVLAH